MGNCISNKYYKIEKDKNNQIIYEGSFKNKKRHGYAIEYKNNKKIYEGQWYNNKKFGCGTLYDNNENLILNATSSISLFLVVVVVVVVLLVESVPLSLLSTLVLFSNVISFVNSFVYFF